VNLIDSSARRFMDGASIMSGSDIMGSPERNKALMAQISKMRLSDIQTIIEQNK
jgi:hypothetical protein